MLKHPSVAIQGAHAFAFVHEPIKHQSPLQNQTPPTLLVMVNAHTFIPARSPTINKQKKETFAKIITYLLSPSKKQFHFLFLLCIQKKKE